MINSFKLGALYSIKLISCRKCPYDGVSSCNSFSWLSGPSGLLSLSCSQEGCLHRTNTSWIWATMTLLQQISDILAQSSWAQKKTIWAVVWVFFCHLPYLATPSLCDKNMILSRTKLGWQLSLHQSWDRLIFPHETLSIYGADHLSSRKTRKIVRLSRL